MSQFQTRTASAMAEPSEPVIPNSDPLLGVDAWSEFTAAKQRFLMRLEAQSREFRSTGVVGNPTVTPNAT